VDIIAGARASRSAGIRYDAPVRRLAWVSLVAVLCGGAICGVKGRPHPPRAVNVADAGTDADAGP
jgi:hypothetical protein